MSNKKEWSNDPMADPGDIPANFLRNPDPLAKPPERRDVPIEPTPREEWLVKLAEEAKKFPPKAYDITSKNAKATRIVHDFDGNKISIRPGETRKGILLHPHAAAYLGQGDLTVTATAVAA